MNESPTNPPNFYVKSEEKTEKMAFAFTLESSFKDEIRPCFALFWKPNVKSVLGEMRKRARENSKNKFLQLPYTALRFENEAKVPDVLLISSDLELTYFNENKQGKESPFLIGEDAQTDAAVKMVSENFGGWIHRELLSFCNKYQVELNLLDRLDELYVKDNVLYHQADTIRPFDWSAEKSNFASRFGNLSSALLKALTGVVIHPKLGKLSPIISRWKNSNAIELMTKPYPLEDKGEFSLRLKLSVETIPNYDKPVITVTFTRTRWLGNDISPGERYGKKITGYVHDRAISGRCIVFDLIKDWGAGKYEFSDDVYARISEYCKLPPDGTVEDLMACRLNSDNANVRAIYANQMAKHPIQHGFTTTDRVGFFDTLIEPLAKVGVVPWRDWDEVSFKAKIRKPKRSNFEIAAFLEALADDPAEKPVDEEKAQALVEETLRKAFSLEPDVIAASDKLISKKAKCDELEKVRKLNIEAVKRIFGDEKPSLVIVGKNSVRKKIIDKTIKLLFGDSLKTQQAPLPDKTYGIKPKDIKSADHIQTQVAVWSGIINKVRDACSKPVLAMVESPRWFSLNGKLAKDSPLNKTAARMAWADASVPLQYLNLPEQLKSGKIKLNGYLFRIQSAVYALVFAHSGYAEAVPESVEALFTGKMAERKPKYVVGLSVLAGNRTRLGKKHKLIVAVRHEIDTGKSSLRYSHWDGKEAKISEWMKFTDGLCAISRLSEHTLGTKQKEIGNSIAEFCYKVINELNEDDPNAVVIVNRTHINHYSAWGWLRDSELRADNISIGRHKFKKSSWKGIRIIRCRTDIPPGICQRKEALFKEIDEQGNVKHEEPVRVERHTNVQTLAKVRQANLKAIPTFLSVAGLPTTHQLKRGTSVFEKKKLDFPVVNKGKGKAYVEFAPKTDKTVHIIENEDILTKPAGYPRSVEFAIAHKHPDDQDENLVRFVESLRSGHAQYKDWTSLPFVLHAMSTVKEYVNTFALEEEIHEAWQR